MKNLAHSFTHLTLFNALGYDYSQRAPVSTVQGFFFHLGTDRARASTELIYYGSRNVPVMLTLVIGNNVCRERIEKERKKRGYAKRERVQRVFLLRVTHLIRVEYVPCEMSRKLKLWLEFSGNVTGKRKRAKQLPRN